MLPPIDGGLHCGGDYTTTGTAASPSAPAAERRAPLRPAVRRVPLPRHRGAPAVQRRAPLRQLVRGVDEQRLAGAPAFRRRAPLRLRPADRAPDPCVGCSRLCGGLRCGWVMSKISAGDDQRAPAVRRRAPLRRGQVSANGLVDVRAPAIPQRAPLRCAQVGSHGLVDVGAPAVRWRAPLRLAFLGPCQRVPLVLPPFTGGLHCGGVSPTQVALLPITCSRRPTAGSIAATVGRCTGRSSR